MTLFLSWNNTSKRRFVKNLNVSKLPKWGFSLTSHKTQAVVKKSDLKLPWQAKFTQPKWTSQRRRQLPTSRQVQALKAHSLSRSRVTSIISLIVIQCKSSLAWRARQLSWHRLTWTLSVQSTPSSYISAPTSWMCLSLSGLHGSKTSSTRNSFAKLSESHAETE